MRDARVFVGAMYFVMIACMAHTPATVQSRRKRAATVGGRVAQMAMISRREIALMFMGSTSIVVFVLMVGSIAFHVFTIYQNYTNANKYQVFIR